MSKVKHGYALFNKYNVLVCDRIYSGSYEAEPMRKQLCGFGSDKDVSTWKVSLIMEEKVNE
jgi:hypothetical protein